MMKKEPNLRPNRKLVCKNREECMKDRQHQKNNFGKYRRKNKRSKNLRIPLALSLVQTEEWDLSGTMYFLRINSIKSKKKSWRPGVISMMSNQLRNLRKKKKRNRNRMKRSNSSLNQKKNFYRKKKSWWNK